MQSYPTGFLVLLSQRPKTKDKGQFSSRPTTAFKIPTMLASLIGTGVVTAACSAGYQSMAPTGQWYGRTFTGLPRGSKQLALTYDDGPNDPHTLRLLEVLAKHNVKATFFLIGRFIDQRPDIARVVA